MKYISLLFVLLFPLTVSAANAMPAPTPDTAIGKIKWAVEGSGKMPTKMAIGFLLLAVLIIVTVFVVRRSDNNE